MKLFGIPHNKFLFHLLSYNVSGFLSFVSYIGWAIIMNSIYPKFLIGSKGYANELAVVNIFILSIVSTFLIYIVNNYKVHLFIIIVMEILLFCIVIFLYYNDRGTKLEGFYSNLIISAPYILISSSLIYLIQLILGKKLLPTMYKNNSRNSGKNEHCSLHKT